MSERAASLMGSAPADPHADRLVQSLIDVAGQDQIRTVLLFGSRLVQASPDRFSAYDLVLVVENYRRFYDALARAGLSQRPPALQAVLNRLLAPNVVAFAPEGWNDGPVAKIMVLEPAAVARALSRRAPDHFLKGRLVQKVALLHARDGAASDWITALVTDARHDILRWAGPFLGESFTPAEAALGMLQVSYRGEVRAEAADRVLDVFESQRPFLADVLTSVLADAADAGELRLAGGNYQFVRAPSSRERWSVRLYFARSKARATARWLKHVVTFDNWLDYIARKVERRTGTRVEITPWEAPPALSAAMAQNRACTAGAPGAIEDRTSGRVTAWSTTVRPELAVLLGTLAVGLLSVPVYAVGRRRRGADPLAGGDRGSFVLGAFVRNWFYWFIGPLERAESGARTGTPVLQPCGCGLGSARWVGLRQRPSRARRVGSAARWGGRYPGRADRARARGRFAKRRLPRLHAGPVRGARYLRRAGGALPRGPLGACRGRHRAGWIAARQLHPGPG